jgi:hypothetical protein
MMATAAPCGSITSKSADVRDVLRWNQDVRAVRLAVSAPIDIVNQA